MATIVTAPQSIDGSGVKVYLGGAIDMGKAVNWQAEVIEALRSVPNLIVINPRRKKFTDDTLDEQIRWELDALEKSDTIIIWFPADSDAPISLLEAGLYMKSGKLLLGAAQGFFRRRNLEITSEYYGVVLYSRLEDIIQQILNEHRTGKT